MKNTTSVYFDNIATASHPLWRGRVRKPFTCYAVRMDLVALAALLPEWERERFLDERLTDLDRALSCDEAQALEAWLDCEEMLLGCAKTVDWDGGSGGGGRSTPVSDDDMDALKLHADAKRRLSGGSRISLEWLALMMEKPQWLLNAHFIRGVVRAAAELTNLHS